MREYLHPLLKNTATSYHRLNNCKPTAPSKYVSTNCVWWHPHRTHCNKCGLWANRWASKRSFPYAASISLRSTAYVARSKMRLQASNTRAKSLCRHHAAHIWCAAVDNSDIGGNTTAIYATCGVRRHPTTKVIRATRTVQVPRVCPALKAFPRLSVTFSPVTSHLVRQMTNRGGKGNTHRQQRANQ